MVRKVVRPATTSVRTLVPCSRSRKSRSNMAPSLPPGRRWCQRRLSDPGGRIRGLPSTSRLLRGTPLFGWGPSRVWRRIVLDESQEHEGADGQADSAARPDVAGHGDPGQSDAMSVACCSSRSQPAGLTWCARSSRPIAPPSRRRRSITSPNVGGSAYHTFARQRRTTPATTSSTSRFRAAPPTTICCVSSPTCTNRPLDRDRPLFRNWLIDGVPGEPIRPVHEGAPRNNRRRVRHQARLREPELERATRSAHAGIRGRGAGTQAATAASAGGPPRRAGHSPRPGRRWRCATFRSGDPQERHLHAARQRPARQHGVLGPTRPDERTAGDVAVAGDADPAPAGDARCRQALRRHAQRSGRHDRRRGHPPLPAQHRAHLPAPSRRHVPDVAARRRRHDGRHEAPPCSCHLGEPTPPRERDSRRSSTSMGIAKHEMRSMSKDAAMPYAIAALGLAELTNGDARATGLRHPCATS